MKSGLAIFHSFSLFCTIYQFMYLDVSKIFGHISRLFGNSLQKHKVLIKSILLFKYVDNHFWFIYFYFIYAKYFLPLSLVMCQVCEKNLSVSALHCWNNMCFTSFLLILGILLFPLFFSFFFFFLKVCEALYLLLY